MHATVLGPCRTSELFNMSQPKEHSMHAVLITFHSSVSLDAVHVDFLAGAQAIADVPGLLSKTWLQDGER